MLKNELNRILLKSALVLFEGDWPSHCCDRNLSSRFSFGWFRGWTASALDGFSLGWLQPWMALALNGFRVGLLLKQVLLMLHSHGTEELEMNS